MRKYFQKMENCNYRGFHRLLSKIGINPTKHGYKGWLSTNKAIPLVALGDPALVKAIVGSAATAIKKVGHPLERLKWALESKLDPNDWRLVKENSVGLRYPPLANDKHARVGTKSK